ncbi:hypothetical protein [Salinibacter ruber]|jgi:hypothetical protein|uniref:hypothetical protein n=1 Tax=Salinibacter ruber TaxID=146919 RepID=UPI00216882F2|nr:hypothetical protein [Salinibacter ruber]MCS4198528.1 hypothetical protein [Salinibacter ruber]
MEATDSKTSEKLKIVDILSMVADDLDAVQGVIEEIQIEAKGAHADRLLAASRALKDVASDVEDAHERAESLR